MTLAYRVIVVELERGCYEAYVRAFPDLAVTSTSAQGAVEAARAELTRLLEACAREGRRPPPADRQAAAIELIEIPFEPQHLYRPTVCVEVTSGKVLLDGAQIPLRGTALELIVSLAADTRDTPVDLLYDRLYPGTGADQAYNALKMCVYRVRKLLGARDVIETTERGYRLAESVVVDVRFLPQIVRAIRSRSIAKAIETRLDAIFAQLTAARPAVYETWNWFGPVERALQTSAREIGMYLAQRALRDSQTHRALEIAGTLAAMDPLDEAVCELEIRVHLARGDRASALQAYRRYADDLREMQGMEPSAALRAMVT